MINIGLIGLGRWGINYLKTIRLINGINLKWISALSGSTIKFSLELISERDKINYTKKYSDMLLDKSLDAVIISTPVSTHYEIAKKSLLAKKHVLCEKPVVLTSKELNELISIAKKNNLVFMPAHLHLYNPAISRLKVDIESGKFGKIYYIRTIGTGFGPVRQDISAFWDIMIHDCYIIHYLIGSNPLSIYADGGAYLNRGIEDIAMLNMEFKDKIVTTSFVSWLHPEKKRKIIVSAEKMLAVVDDYAKNKLIYYKNTGVPDKARVKKELNPEVQNLCPENPLNLQLKAFTESIEGISLGNVKYNLSDLVAVTSIMERAHKLIISKIMSRN